MQNEAQFYCAGNRQSAWLVSSPYEDPVSFYKFYSVYSGSKLNSVPTAQGTWEQHNPSIQYPDYLAVARPGEPPVHFSYPQQQPGYPQQPYGCPPQEAAYQQNPALPPEWGPYTPAGFPGAPPRGWISPPRPPPMGPGHPPAPPPPPGPRGYRPTPRPPFQGGAGRGERRDSGRPGSGRSSFGGTSWRDRPDWRDHREPPKCVLANKEITSSHTVEVSTRS